MALIEAFYETFLSTVWIAFLVGVIVGCSWKSKWASIKRDKLGCFVSKTFDMSLPPSPSAAAAMSPIKAFGSAPCLSSFNLRPPLCDSWAMVSGVENRPPSVTPTEYDDSSSLQLNEQNPVVVVTEDLEHLWKLVEMTDGGPTWIHMMDRSTPNMSYQAWRRDPKNGPPQYRSVTVFEDVTPQMVRDFFWDDEFRAKWDDMLAYSSTIEECPATGTMVVQWIRKFPFFCSDREYIIGRRIWELGRSYYCVTKGVPCPSVPTRDKPKRVNLYYSSWCIRAVESKRGNGQLTACEVLLFHHEDMGIPREIAKLGIRQGMWGAVKKVEQGLRAYQKARALGEPLPRSAFLAGINTQINPDYLRSLGGAGNSLENEMVAEAPSNEPLGNNIPKLLVIGSAIVIACSLDQSLLTKTVIFGVARRFANIGKKL